MLRVQTQLVGCGVGSLGLPVFLQSSFTISLHDNTFKLSLQASQYYSLMADESTDTSSQEELSICARWLCENKAVEHFLGIIHAKEITAKAVLEYLRFFSIA